MSLRERDISVLCRKEDESAVKSVLEAAKAQVKNATGKDVNLALSPNFLPSGGEGPNQWFVPLFNPGLGLTSFLALVELSCLPWMGPSNVTTLWTPALRLRLRACCPKLEFHCLGDPKPGSTSFDWVAFYGRSL